MSLVDILLIFSNVSCSTNLDPTTMNLEEYKDIDFRNLVDGKVKYTIPEGTQTGTVFRLREKGVPKLRGNSRGDQYVKVIVDTPKKLNEKQKELLRQFAAECGENVHEKKSSFARKMENLFKKK